MSDPTPKPPAGSLQQSAAPAAPAAPAPEGAAERTRHKVRPDRVKPNDLMAFVHFVRVLEVSPGGEAMKVHDLDHDRGDIEIGGRALVENALSADQYEEEVRVSMTRAAEVLVAAHNRPLTVCFVKQGSKRTGEGAGEPRVLRGRLVEPNGLLGRSLCEDLDLPETQNRLREVDHRTIKYLIVDGVKYVVK
ncbi:MAG TPA: hypothetical protein VFS43_45010 [Polyangiaceae bacterium]|nr:hypothetical protein [Polyangiaceae bacterium]